MKSIRIKISGRVYKTGYRYYLKQIAERLHISGTIKYSFDRQVLVIAHGSAKNIEQFISYCRLGCLGSDVGSITIKSITKNDDWTNHAMTIIEN